MGDTPSAAYSTCDSNVADRRRSFDPAKPPKLCIQPSSCCSPNAVFALRSTASRLCIQACTRTVPPPHPSFSLQKVFHDTRGRLPIAEAVARDAPRSEAQCPLQPLQNARFCPSDHLGEVDFHAFGPVSLFSGYDTRDSQRRCLLLHSP